MRIGFDAKRYFFNATGLGNYSRDLIRMLEQHYPEHAYLKYSPKLPQNSTPELLTNIRTPQTFLGRKFTSLWRQKWIVDDLMKENVEIFHGLSGEIPVGLQKANIKSVVTVHDLIFLRLPELYKPIDRFIYQRKLKHACQQSDRIIAISEQTKRDIISYYGIADEKIEVIYQGCHPAFKREKSDLEKIALRKKYNLPENFILNVGSIEPRKNAFQIVKAVEQLDVPLVIIGKETSYAVEIKKHIHSRNLQNKVFILQGFSIEELATIYAMAQIFVYPAKYEGFGIPIIEALYAGTPVITNKHGVFKEAGGPGSAYIDPENVEELASTISSLLANPDKRLAMKIEGLNYVQQFNDDCIAQQMNAFYRTLLP